MPDADNGASRITTWTTKMKDPSTWTNANTNYNAAKPQMKENYPFGGKMGRNYVARIDRATWRQPTSAEIDLGARKLRQASSG